MDLNQLIAHEAIRQVLYRYCRGIDRGDPDLVASVYHADARDDHGTFQGSAREFAQVVTAGMDRQTLTAQHHITNVLIDLHGDSADVESYFLALHPSGEGAGETLAQVGGRYLDRFERRDGEWLIADRQVILDWTRSSLPGEPWETASAFAQGGRREADPSWARLGGISASD